ncbi:MAG: type IV toxin-antitoxin system AbiEi family antitoxin domain-containing protein [Elusimicrobiales bacterium]
MAENSLLHFVEKLDSPVFTTGGLAAFSGKSASTVTQGLKFLQRQGVVQNVSRGVWARGKGASPYAAAALLLPRSRTYVSFVSALHLHGVISQIPQEVTLASTAHTREIRTSLGSFSVRRVAPYFFAGFGWYKGGGKFLVAEPEKALVDCLYLSAYGEKRYAHFPELDLDGFSFKKAYAWARRIRGRAATHVLEKLKAIEAQYLREDK